MAFADWKNSKRAPAIDIPAITAISDEKTADILLDIANIATIAIAASENSKKIMLMQESRKDGGGSSSGGLNPVNSANIPNALASNDPDRYQPLQETRQTAAVVPYSQQEIEALLRRHESQLLAHVVHCPNCRTSDRRWCAHGFTIGSAYDALLMVFDDADDRHHAFVSRVIRKRLEGCK